MAALRRSWQANGSNAVAVACSPCAGSSRTCADRGALRRDARGAQAAGHRPTDPLPRWPLLAWPPQRPPARPRRGAPDRADRRSQADVRRVATRGRQRADRGPLGPRVGHPPVEPRPPSSSRPTGATNAECGWTRATDPARTASGRCERAPQLAASRSGPRTDVRFGHHLQPPIPVVHDDDTERGALAAGCAFIARLPPVDRLRHPRERIPLRKFIITGMAVAMLAAVALRPSLRRTCSVIRCRP